MWKIKAFLSVITPVIFQQAPHVRKTQPTHTHRHTLPARVTETWPHSYPLTRVLHPASGVTTLLWVTYWMSGGFSLLHKPPTNEAPSASPLTASVPELRFSTRVWWTCRDARWAWEIHTHADWHNSCEWAKWRISRKTVWWLLLSNHGRKVSMWVRPLGPQLCAANRPADDALNSAQTNVFSSALQLH